MRISTTLAVAIGLGALAACEAENGQEEEQTVENAAEDVGEGAEDVAEDVGNAAEDVAEEAENQVE